MTKREMELRKQAADVKTDEAIMEKIAKEASGIGTLSPGSVVTEDSGPVLYGGLNPIARSESILTSKVSGWIGVFGDHYLCELGCKRYASKRLDDVIKFFEREVRLWYKAKELVKKGKLDVEVKGHVRKSRKKKEEKMDEVVDEKVKVSDEVPEGKVLFVKDENIKVKE